MCIAYTLTQTSQALTEHFQLNSDQEVEPRYNARPSQLLPVITQGEDKGLSLFYWGAIPSFSKKKSISEKLINTKSELLNELVVHKAALQQRRCLIPADGFYAWKPISKKGLIPYRYFLNDNAMFSFAGLWEEFENENGEVVHTFSILTTWANELLQPTGSRMPVILDKSTKRQWLEGSVEEATDLLIPFSSEKMGSYAVSSRVNDPEYDEPNLIEPAPPADQFGNLSLFD